MDSIDVATLQQVQTKVVTVAQKVVDGVAFWKRWSWEEKPEKVLAQNVDQLLRLVTEIVSEQDTKTLKLIYQVFIESVTFDR